MVRLHHTSWLKDKKYIHWDDKIEGYVVNDDAPEDVKEEYRLYWEEVKKWQKLEEETGCTII